MADFTIKQYATLPILEAVLRRAGAPVNLVGATVKLVLRARTDPDNASKVKIFDADVIDDGTEALRGQVQKEFTAVDTAAALDMLGNWHVKFSDDSVDVFPESGAFTFEIESAPDAFAP